MPKRMHTYLPADLLLSVVTDRRHQLMTVSARDSCEQANQADTAETKPESSLAKFSWTCPLFYSEEWLNSKAHPKIHIDASAAVMTRQLYLMIYAQGEASRTS